MDAVNKLKEKPLSITDEEQSSLERIVKNAETKKIVGLYNRNSDVKFECLPSEAQTVIASVAYQYGYLPSETPAFWKQAIKKDWQAMYENLIDFEDTFVTRRKKEANLIKGLL